MSPEAVNDFGTFYNEIEGRLGIGGIYEAIRPFASKASEHAARLAAVLQVVEDPNASIITVANVHRAIQLMRFYLGATERLITGGQLDPLLVKAQQLLDWLHKKKHSLIYVELIYQKGPCFVRQASEALPLIRILEKHGWLIRMKAGSVVDGKSRQQAWKVCPAPAIQV